MCKAIDDMMRDAREEEHKVMQKKLDEKQNRLDKYEKEIEELKRQLAEKQTA